jgi:hypothetical protein
MKIAMLPSQVAVRVLKTTIGVIVGSIYGSEYALDSTRFYVIGFN